MLSETAGATKRFLCADTTHHPATPEGQQAIEVATLPDFLKLTSIPWVIVAPGSLFSGSAACFGIVSPMHPSPVMTQRTGAGPAGSGPCCGSLSMEVHIHLWPAHEPGSQASSAIVRASSQDL